MTNNTTTLADSIAHISHFAAFDALVKQRLSNLELDKLLVYLIDTVDAKGLPYLAEQFDVLGYKGMKLAHTEADQRQLIKTAIELHRYKGTLWAVEQSLASIGFGDVTIEEHVSGHWAKFRVFVDIGSHPINVIEIADVVQMINEYKNTRSHLADLSYTLTFDDDNIQVEDQMNDAQETDDVDSVTIGGDFVYNGNVLFDGSRNFSQDSDTLTINVINI